MNEVLQERSVITRQARAELARVGEGMVVRRALPVSAFDSIGPFVFLDEFGPTAATSTGVPAHPHAGIEVITYLIEGINEHRDSYGHVGRVSAGGLQWMRAGRGALHSEFPAADSGPVTHGIQLWTRLPRAHEDDEPRYRGVIREEVPEVHADGVTLRLLAGELGDVVRGQSGPVTLAQGAVLVVVVLEPGASVVLPVVLGYEIGVYVMKGAVEIGHAKERLEEARIGVLSHGGEVELASAGGCRVLVLGGEPAERPLVFHGPFVFASEARVRRAMRDYAEGRMGQLDGVPRV
jgi:redox-sensitive bicupin YhaK (pirin superfamily)